jgi:CRP-like cAMP-binding protein
MLRHRVDLSAFDGVALFERYDADMLAPLAPHADRLAVTPGVMLAREGHRAREVLVIVSGEVTVWRSDRLVDRLGPGAVIGAHEETAGTPHDASYVAGSGVVALALPGPSFRWAVQTLTGLAPDLGLGAPAC